MNMTFWKTFWASLLASFISGIVVVGIFFLLLNIFVASIGSLFEVKKLAIEPNTVLHMELNGGIGDYSYNSFNPASLQLESQFGLSEFLEGLKIAEEDENIEGIFLNCDNVSAGLATIKEMRDGLEAFQASGKFIVAYHENYDKKAYYLSSVAEELYVFPSGMMEFLGLGTEIMFLKGALEKLDVEMQIIRGSNNKFKSAVEPLLYEKMSAANRKQTQKYLDALWEEMLTAIGTSRNLTADELNTIADSAFIRKSSDAVDYKMADGVKYYDDILSILADKAGTNEEGEVELVPFKKYALKMTKEERILSKLEDPNIAVIFAEGEIVDGTGETGQIGGTTFSNLIRDARTDENIKGVILRINSPGGSALASDIIWREVVLTKAVKPIVVSMGDVAASGGYYIACAADTIYAQPNTITGSIGVFGIIPYLGEMFKNKLGVTFDRVQTNQHAVLSLTKRLEEDELTLIQEGVDDIYEDFISKVGAGRGMTNAEVDSIGQGRVWAGTDALEIGLIDAYGGLQDAIDDVVGRAEIPTDSVTIKYYPEMKEEPYLEILEQLEGESISVQQSQIEAQLFDIYTYLKTVSTTTSFQARLPYLYWID